MIPGDGNDHLFPAQVYILSIFGSQTVLTEMGNQHLRLEQYSGTSSQHWRLDPCDNGKLTFANVKTGHSLGANPEHGFLCCKWDNQAPAEQFSMFYQTTGGYRAYNHWGNLARVVTRRENEDFLRTTRTGAAFVTIGVHLLTRQMLGYN
ncbi:hypothetical protein F5Y07DRAFT_265271 [Xylaria sp. FL0933]|nr:hypothetical protein F5Y07DRAFT_265271 [Xylaria sp. FL0933]